MKRRERFVLLILLVGAIVATMASVTGSASRWITSAGLMLVMAGIVQLDISGLFDQIAAKYFNEKHYPYGPPSHITREIIDNPDAPILMVLRNTLFINGRTGFWLLAIAFVFQLISTWL
jgi:hypothetical protein